MRQRICLIEQSACFHCVHIVVDHGFLQSDFMFQTPHGAGLFVTLFVVVMVGDTPNTAVVPLASTLLTNPTLSHSVFQCTL